jgi:hypothetical protein
MTVVTESIATESQPKLGIFPSGTSAFAITLPLVLGCFSIIGIQRSPSGTFTHDLQVAKGMVASALSWQSPALALQDHDFLVSRVVEEHGWSVERAKGAIVEYLRFLVMLAEAPKMELVASSDIDLVWHEHLIDTKNYAADCQRLFGHFIHHRRARTPDELAEIPEAYQNTKDVYKSRFGETPPLEFWGETTMASSMCGGGGGTSPDDKGPATSATGNSSSSAAAAQTPTSTTSTASSVHIDSASIAAPATLLLSLMIPLATRS